MSEQLNFEQMIEESMKNINVKETIEGTAGVRIFRPLKSDISVISCFKLPT